MKRLILILFFKFGFLAGNALFAQDIWDLNRCISYAIEHNLGLKKMEVQEQIAAEDFSQAKRNLLPGISASSRAGVSFGRSVDPNTNDIVNTEFFNNSYELGASVTLFDGFRQINQIEYQKFRKKAGELNRLNAADDLAFAVMSSYFEVLYYQGMLKIAGEQVETSRLNLRKIEKQVELGMKSKTDLLEMKANYETEELRRIQVENSLKSSRLQLMQRMNNISDGDLLLKEVADPLVSPEKPDRQNLFSSYTQWSPYFKSYEAQMFASRKALAISRSQLYPTLNAFGSAGTGFYETTKDDNGKTIQFGSQLKNNLNQYLGASVNIPIFSRWGTRSNVKKAKLQYEYSQNTLEEEKQKLYFEMVSNLNELEALEKEYAQYMRQQEADQQAFQASEKKFEQGLINVVDFYIAKNRLASSGSQVLKARMLWEAKRKILDFYQGKRFWE